MDNKDKTIKFINKSKLVHGDKYDYSLTKYVNAKTKVAIICLVHGIYKQTASDHLSNKGCKMCGNRKISSSKKSSLNDFIIKARCVHGEKYDYSNVEYINSKTKISILCNKCQTIFEQTPNNHLKNRGCYNCFVGKKKTLIDFLKKAQDVHKNKYDYSLVKFDNIYSKIKIKCNKCQTIYNQTLKSHLQGSDCCTLCYRNNTSKGERKIKEILEKNNIFFEHQKKFDNCKNPKTDYFLTFDFYLPKYNTLIEFDGQQHFKSNSLFSDKGEFINIKNRDKIKNEFAKENNIKLIRIGYAQFKNIEHILNDFYQADKHFDVVFETK